MLRTIAVGAMFLAAELYSSLASAGVYTDDLSKCLVNSSGTEDKIALIQWVFSTLTLNPAVASLSSVKPEQRDEFDRKLAEIATRLVLVDCRKQTIDAVKYEGEKSIESSFEVLGNIAARALMSDPTVASGTQGFIKYLDQSKFQELGKEAGAQ